MDIYRGQSYSGGGGGGGSTRGAISAIRNRVLGNLMYGRSGGGGYGGGGGGYGGGGGGTVSPAPYKAPPEPPVDYFYTVPAMVAAWAAGSGLDPRVVSAASSVASKKMIGKEGTNPKKAYKKVRGKLF